MPLLRAFPPAIVAVLLTGPLLADDAPGPRRFGIDPKVGPAAVEKGKAFLKAHQAEDGTFSKGVNPGITAVAVLALARTGPKDDPTIGKAVAAIEAQVDEATGSICKGAASTMTNYLTSINVQALAEAAPEAHARTIERAARFLIALQFAEANPPELPAYEGGVGYDGKLRPDLSNTSMTIQAVTAAGVPKDDPFYANALRFVSRCQNHKSEHSDEPWAGLVDDGSFLYGCGPTAERMYTFFDGTAVKPGDPHQGYGSMTAAGLISLDLCGVGRDDPRLRKALRWLSDEFTTDANPGFDGPLGGCGNWCYYYYLCHLAKALDRLGVDEVVDRKGRVRDWRAEVTRALAQRQRPDGSWSSETPMFFEDNPDLATSFALIALSHCAPKPGR